MNEKKKKFVEDESVFKVEMLNAYINSGKCCVCEKKEKCVIGVALGFLKEYPDVSMEKLMTLVSMFEASLSIELLMTLIEASFVQEIHSVHFYPLEEIQEGEVKAKRTEYEEKGLKDDVEAILGEMEEAEKAGGCKCGKKYCPLGKAFDLRREYGIPTKKMAELIALVENNAREDFANPVFKTSDEWDN